MAPVKPTTTANTASQNSTTTSRRRPPPGAAAAAAGHGPPAIHNKTKSSHPLSSLGSLLRYMEGIEIIVELKTGKRHRGILSQADEFMNLTLDDVVENHTRNSQVEERPAKRIAAGTHMTAGAPPSPYSHGGGGGGDDDDFDDNKQDFSSSSGSIGQWQSATTAPSVAAAAAAAATTADSAGGTETIIYERNNNNTNSNDNGSISNNIYSSMDIRGANIRYIHFPDNADLSTLVKAGADRERNAAKKYNRGKRKT